LSLPRIEQNAVDHDMTAAGQAARKPRCRRHHILRQLRFDQNRLRVLARPAYALPDPGLAKMRGKVAITPGVVIENITRILQRCAEIANHLGLGRAWWRPVGDLVKFTFEPLR